MLYRIAPCATADFYSNLLSSASYCIVANSLIATALAVEALVAIVSQDN